MPGLLFGAWDATLQQNTAGLPKANLSQQPEHSRGVSLEREVVGTEFNPKIHLLLERTVGSSYVWAYRFMAARKSALFLVSLSFSSKNSMLSTGLRGDRSFRSIQMRFRSSSR